jgi:subtilisin family serine protease
VTSNGVGAFDVAKPVLDSKVAVLDTGIECNHPDLNVALAKAFISEQSPDPRQDPACYDGYGHGTHCAGEGG